MPFNHGTDLGLATVTGEAADERLFRVSTWLFRVSTWRNVSLTAPYFHDGSAATLEDAVRTMAVVQLNRTLTDEEVFYILAFLESLVGDAPEITIPELPVN